MTTIVKQKTRAWTPILLVVIVVGLVAWTVSNQLAINRTNHKLTQQAHAGQVGLNRTCALIPISRKIWVDDLKRAVITPSDFAKLKSSASRACAAATPASRR